MAKNRLKLAAAVMLAAGGMASAQSLTTNLSNNGSGGVFMDLTPIAAPLEITSFETQFTGTVGTAVDVEVWVRPGSYVGFDASSAGWTLVDTVSTVRNGIAVNSMLTLTQPIVLPEGATTAVYLQTITTGGGIRYYGTSTTNQSNYGNADLNVFSDVARVTTTAFAGTRNSPRAFSGTINYQPGGPAVPGACCFNDGTCQSLLGSECFTQGGTFRGGGTDCATANCPQPAACCFADGSCAVLQQGDCVTQGGTFNAGAATCAIANCPQPPTGACCFADGTCAVLWEGGCIAQNGFYRGDNSTCATVTCPTSLTTTYDGTLSATVASAGVFFDVTADNQAGIVVAGFQMNSPAAAGTAMTVQVWTKPGTFVGAQQSQAEWTMLGEVQTTAAGVGLPTTVPIGGLHIARGETYGIRMTTLSGGHRYSSEATTVPIHSNSDLTITLGQVQNSNWGTLLSGTRGWNGSLFYTVGATVETGACCLPSGACGDFSQAYCTAAGGTFQGVATTCATTSCPQPPTGACCLPSGSCAIMWEGGCLAERGTYFGDNSTCTGLVCPTIDVFPQLPHAGANTFPFSQTPGTTMHQVYSSDQFAAISGGLPIEISRIAFAPTSTGTFSGNVVLRFGYTNAIGGELPATGGLDVPAIGGGGAPNAIGPMQDFFTGFVNHTGVNDPEDFSLIFDGTPFIYDPALGNLLSEIYITDLTGGMSISRAAGGPLGSRTYHRHSGTTGILNAQAHRTEMTILVVNSACYANCDGSTVEPVLNVDDFTCFINEYASAQGLPHEQQITAYANCDGSTTAPVLNVDDFTCFINSYALGCP
jgi:hypothetical protein